MVFKVALAGAKGPVGRGIQNRFNRMLARNGSTLPVVDLRSDTVTQPSREMLECAMTAQTGDDVMGEDPTVLKLEEYAAQICGKEAALYVPTGTMSNLVALLAHCHERASEIIVGANSHICLYEGGNISGLGGIHSRQLVEDPMTAQLSLASIRDTFRLDNDDHYPKTQTVCLEHTHNILGGVVLDSNYIHSVGKLCHEELNVKLHIDGARFFNAAVATATQQSNHTSAISITKDLLKHVDSISLCLSKGLGAPLGSVLVGDTEFIRLAKRARKRCGGGMRQSGVVAAMGLYALQNNVERLAEDHTRAKRLGQELFRNGLQLMRNGQLDSNLVFFALPIDCAYTKEQFVRKLSNDYNIKLGSGYSTTYHEGGKYFRAAVHMDVDEEGIDRAAEAIVALTTGKLYT